jgi:hypothetical protein
MKDLHDASALTQAIEFKIEVSRDFDFQASVGFIFL